MTTVDRVAAPAMPMPAYVSQSTAIEQARAVAEVLAAVVVAQQCPRDMQRAWAEMRAACSRLALAEKAFYSVPNRGSDASIHLARALAAIWGNLDYGMRELRRDDTAQESEIQAFCWDQQTNVRNSRAIIVPHARMKKVRGEQTREVLVDLGDVNLNNQNVAARNVRMCVFAVLPADYVAEAKELCRKTLENGDGLPLDQRIANMITWFRAIDVSVARIETRLGRKRGQWTAADVAELSVVYSSIQRGETVADVEFPAERVTADEITATAKPKASKGTSAERAGEDWPETAQPGGSS